MNGTLRAALAILTAFSCLSIPAIAQTVAIENAEGGKGFGFMIRHREVCHVILPEHVAGSSLITVTSAAPVETGTGFVSRPFWPGMDLAIATVRGGIEGRCTATLADLDVTAAERASRTAQLERLSPVGEVMRDDITIGDLDYLTFKARRTKDGTAIRKGTSGAYAFVGNTPIGMAIRSPDDETGLFMRTDEIALNVRRYVEDVTTLDAVPAVASTSEAPQGALGLNFRRTTRPPVSPEHAPENMLGPGLYAFEPDGPVAIEFDIAGPTAQPVSRLVVTTPPGAGFALPREVLIEISPLGEGERFSRLGRFEMAGDGILDTRRIAPRNTRRLRLTVLNARGAGPLAIDTVAAY